MDAMNGVYLAKAAKYVAAGLCMALGGLGPALAQGFIGGKFLESAGKNPEVAKSVAFNAMISMVIVETSTLFSFTIAMILLLAVR